MRLNSQLVFFTCGKKEIKSNNILDSIDHLAVNPFLTVQSLSKSLSVAFTTAQRVIDKLEKLNIIKIVDVKKRRSRVFMAKKILDILEAPPNLRPNDK